MRASLGRRRFLREGSIAAAALAGLHSVCLARAGRQRISRHELIRTRVPMDERVRVAWQRSFFRQGRFQTHYEPVIVKLFADDGLVGSGDAEMAAEPPSKILESVVGPSPWEHKLDGRLGGILIAIYDLIGKAAGLPVSKLFAARTKTHIQQIWWSQRFPPVLMASEAKRGRTLGAGFIR